MAGRNSVALQGGIGMQRERERERAQRISRLMCKLSSKIVKRGARTFQWRN